MAEEIGGLLALPSQEVNGPDKFPPAQDLAYEALQAVQGDRVLLGEGQGFLQDLLGRQQPDVDEGGKYGMKNYGLLEGDGVFVVPEKSQAVFQKVPQPSLGLFMGRRVQASV